MATEMTRVAQAEASASGGEAGGVDRHLARLLDRLAGREDPLVTLGAQLACRVKSRGHICADLAELAGRGLAEIGAEGPGAAPPLTEWCAALRGSPVVGRPGEYAPLILDEAGRLYLYRS